MQLIQLFTNKKNILIALIAFAIFFGVNYYIMRNLLGTTREACTIGGGLTTLNILFALVTSLAFGVLLAGMVELYRHRKTTKRLNSIVTGASLIGSFISLFTVFCAACTLPFIFFFGTAISLSFLTEFEIEFKLMSLTLIFLALYLLNRQLEGCDVCAK